MHYQVCTNLSISFKRQGIMTYKWVTLAIIHSKGVIHIFIIWDIPNNPFTIFSLRNEKNRLKCETTFMTPRVHEQEHNTRQVEKSPLCHRNPEHLTLQRLCLHKGKPRQLWRTQRPSKAHKKCKKHLIAFHTRHWCYVQSFFNKCFAELYMHDIIA
jgi:hypothetical protein